MTLSKSIPTFKSKVNKKIKIAVKVKVKSACQSDSN